MSKILRRCLSLALAFMLLASLSVTGTLEASADNKTGDGLAAYAMTAYYEGWSYVWGGASYGAVDCSGLIYSYVGGGARVTEDMLYSSPESGYVSDGVPDIPGLGLWQPGHVGVYVGDGMAVDARDEISNVCFQSVATKSWVMWFKVAGVSYDGDAGVTNDDQSEETDSVTETVLYDDGEDSEDYSYTAPDSDGGEQVDEQPQEDYSYTENPTTQLSDDDETDSEALETGGFTDTADEESTEEDPADEESFPEEDNSGEGSTEVRQEDEEQEEQSSASGSDSAESSSPEDNAVYKTGDEADEICEIQFMLIKLGYFDYDITGVYCENTADAVSRFLGDLPGDVRTLDRAALEALYELYDEKCTVYSDPLDPLNEQAPADSSDEAQETTESDVSSQSDTINDTDALTDTEEEAASDSDVTFTLVDGAVTPVDSEEAADSDSSAGAAPLSQDSGTGAAGNAKPAASYVQSPRTSDSAGVVFIETGVEDYFTKTLSLIVIGISCIVIFFAGTIRYWNVSMERRRQRARRATTVSVYRRSSM